MVQPQAVTRAIITAIGTLLGLYLLYLLREAIVILFIAFLIAAALYPAVGWLQSHRVPRGLGIVFLYLGFVFAVLGIIWLCWHVLTTEGQGLAANLPSYLQRITGWIRKLPGLSNYVGTTPAKLMAAATAHGYSLVTSTLSYVGTITHLLFGVLSVLVLAFFMLLQSHDIEDALLAIFPANRRSQLRHLFKRLAQKAGAYVRGQFVVATAIGIMIWVGLSILHVPFSPLLGLIAFVFDVVPIVGSIAASVLGVVVGLGQSPMLAVWALLVYVVANQIEQNILSPYVFGRAVGIGTFWILVSILCGSVLYGLAGLYLAIPTAVFIKLLLEEYVANKHHAHHHSARVGSSR